MEKKLDFSNAEEIEKNKQDIIMFKKRNDPKNGYKDMSKTD